MTFSQLISILRARWMIVLLILVLTVGTTLVISLLLPKQYTASATVVVDFKPDPVSAFTLGGSASTAYMATQVDIIRSQRVGVRVMRNLRLTESPVIRDQWLEATAGEGSIETWLNGVFQKQMEVTPSLASSVITINYKAGDPAFAATMANAFAQAYIETALELRTDPARLFATFFETQSKEAREALEAAQSKISAFQKQNGIIASDERLDIESARLNELSSQLTMLQAITAESASRQTQAQGAQGDRMQEVLANGIVSQLKSDINRSEAQLGQLSSRLGDAHPQVVELKASLVEMRARLDAETRKVTGGVSVTNTINRQRVADIGRALEVQRDKVLRMKAVRDDGLVLQRDLENSQRSYDALRQRFTQTNLESQTTQSNINILTKASAPVDPSSPRVVLNLALSVFLGSLIALGVGLLLELIDRRVRNLDDVVDALGLPVLGLMPKPGSKLHLGSRPLSLMQQRLMAPLPQTAKGA